MTKRGICANSGHHADTATFEAITCTLKIWTLTTRTKQLHRALRQTCARLSGGAQSRQGPALEGMKVQGTVWTPEQNPAATIARRCFRKTTISPCAPAEKLWGQMTMKAIVKCDRTHGSICYSHWHTDDPARKPVRGCLVRQLHPKVLALILEYHLETRCLPTLVWCFANRNLMFKHFLLLLLRMKPHIHQLTQGKEASRINLKPTLKPFCWYFFFSKEESILFGTIFIK